MRLRISDFSMVEDPRSRLSYYNVFECPPEILEASAAVPTVKVDSWQLGLAFYELSSRAPLYQANLTLSEVMALLPNIQPRAVNIKVDYDYNSLVTRLLQRNPQLRPTASDLLRSNAVALLSQQITEGPPDWWRPEEERAIPELRREIQMLRAQTESMRGAPALMIRTGNFQINFDKRRLPSIFKLCQTLLGEKASTQDSQDSTAKTARLLLPARLSVLPYYIKPKFSWFYIFKYLMSLQVEKICRPPRWLQN